MRHIWNFRRKALGRPQSGHRLCCRTLNFGLRVAATIFEVFATILPLDQERNGIPRYFRRARPSSSVRAVVTMVMFIPFTFSTLS